MDSKLTRRTLLALAGASTVAMAAVAAARAEGVTGAVAAGPTFANRTPMRIGMVTLRVRALDRVTDFYRDAIGMTVIERSATHALLGSGGVALLALEAQPDARIAATSAAGLFHTAFLMPSREDLALWLVHVARNRVPLSGFADHLVSESVYLNDPEGNGVEVYADRAPDQWQWKTGAVAMATDPLKIDDLIALAGAQPAPFAKAPDGMRIGHIHLRVGDLEKADGFYRKTVGLDLTRRREGAAFLSSGGYHHHVAMNVWQSAGAGPRDKMATGLLWFSLNIEKPELLAAQEQRLSQAGAKIVKIENGIEAIDPWGTSVRLIKV